jgi:hypothetical protein
VPSDDLVLREGILARVGRWISERRLPPASLVGVVLPLVPIQRVGPVDREVLWSQFLIQTLENGQVLAGPRVTIKRTSL